MELAGYLRILKRWAWLLILGMAFGGGLTYYLSSSQIPIYQASAKFLILGGQQALPTQDGSILDLSSLSTKEMLQTYNELLTTQPFLDLAIGRLNFPIKASQISAQNLPGTSIVRVTVQDSDPDRVALIANTLVDILIEQNEELQAKRYASSEESLQAQLKQVETQIAGIQADISQIVGETNAGPQAEDSLQNQLASVEAQIAALSAMLSRIAQAQQAYEEAQSLPDPVGKGQPSSTETQPDPIQITGTDIANIETEIANLQAQLVQITQELNNPLPTPQAVPDALNNPQLAQLQTTLALYQQIYSELLSNYESIRFTRTRNTPNVVQVEQAVPPTVPIQPQPLRDTFLGVIVGLIFPGFIALLIEYFDDTLKSPEETHSLLGLPILGFIARINKKEKKSPGIYVLNHPYTPISEAFQLLWTNIEIASQEKQLKTILIVSDIPMAGKTTVAINLAATISQNGKRVVLLDADLRRPAIHKLLELPNETGFHEVIMGENKISQTARLYSDEIELAVITSGNLPPSPPAVLRSNRVPQFFDQIKAKSDIVIIDSPPLMVADSSILAQLVDGILFVVQPGRTRASTVLPAMEHLKRAGARVLGVVMNRVPPDAGYYYHNFYNDYKFYFAGPDGTGNGKMNGNTRTKDGKGKMGDFEGLFTKSLK